MATKDTKNPSRWKKGQSGNPQGRQPGLATVAAIRGRLSTNLERILEQVEQAALGGDMAAARLIIDRVLPARKAEEVPVVLDMPEGLTLAQKAERVIQAVADGMIAPGQASQLLTGLGAVARIVEVTELEQRIATLEERANEKE